MLATEYGYSELNCEVAVVGEHWKLFCSVLLLIPQDSWKQFDYETVQCCDGLNAKVKPEWEIEENDNQRNFSDIFRGFAFDKTVISTFVF